MKCASLVLKSRKTGMGRVRVGDRVEVGPRAVLSNRNNIHCFKESKSHNDKSRDENTFNT